MMRGGLRSPLLRIRAKEAAKALSAMKPSVTQLTSVIRPLIVILRSPPKFPDVLDLQELAALGHPVVQHV